MGQEIFQLSIISSILNHEIVENPLQTILLEHELSLFILLKIPIFHWSFKYFPTKLQ